MRQLILLIAGVCLFALGVGVGVCVPFGLAPGQSVIQDAGKEDPGRVTPPPVRPEPTSEFAALLQFAREQNREGRLLSAKAACETIVAEAEGEIAEDARQVLEAVEQRMQAQRVYLNEARYAKFADGLEASGQKINSCHFDGSMYSMTAEEAREAYAWFFRERDMSRELRINMKYPLYHWGRNHANLQYGLAHGALDTLTARIREGETVAGLATVLESRKGMGATFNRALDFVREMSGHSHLTPEQKGEIYWRVQHCVQRLAPENPDNIPAPVKSLLGALGSTLSRLERFRDKFDPDKKPVAGEEPGVF